MFQRLVPETISFFANQRKQVAFHEFDVRSRIRPPRVGGRRRRTSRTNHPPHHIASIGENRKLLIFKRSEVPEMTRGKGVRLQKFKDGGLSDAVGFALKEGLKWIDASGRTWSVSDLREWIGERAQAGRLPPHGFPRTPRFG